MPLPATIQTSHSALAVIGFNALFNDLADIDQVEASLYRGAPLTNNTPLAPHDAVQRCLNLVLNANTLNLNQIALIVVGDALSYEPSVIADRDRYASYQQEAQLSEALLCSAQLSQQSLAVLIVSASLPTDVLNHGSATISFEQHFEAYAQLQGVACLLLCSDDFAKQHHSVYYGRLEGIASGRHDNDLTQLQAIIAKVINTNTLSETHKITTLEVSSCADTALNQLEQQALINSYQHLYAQVGGEQTLTTAISCHKSVLGENGVLSQLMGLIHALIALQQRYRPAIQDWIQPQSTRLAQWQASPFYLFNQPAPVFALPGGELRSNALSLMTAHCYTHLRLTEPSRAAVHQNGFMKTAPQTLFIVGADSETALLAKLQQLSISTIDLKPLANKLYRKHQQQPCTYTAVLIAASRVELQQECQLSLTGISQAFAQQRDWKTPKGSYFTSQPNPNANSAFLYPGIGASYIGMGRDLFHLFPDIYPSLLTLSDDITTSLQDKRLNPRSVVALNFKQLKQLDRTLRLNLASIAECGVGFACVFTKIFTQVFELQADYACGYSMGEVSMFAALGCWQNPAAMSARLAQSETFNQQLSGELRLLRQLWDLPAVSQAERQKGEIVPIWESYNIKGTLAQVKAVIAADERVYVTLINTPDSLVIAGYPAHCLAVIERLGVRAMPLNIANALHSAPAYQAYQQMLTLYELPVTARIPTKMLSSSCYLPIPQHAKAMAVSIAKCLCEPVDFPRLINQLSEQEVSVFIEMGAGRSLCSWTDKILLTDQSTSQQHISVPVNTKGADEQLTYARAVAKLVSLGVTINIERFFSGSLIQNVSQSVRH